MLNEELQVVRDEIGEARYQDGRFREAAEMMDRLHRPATNSPTSSRLPAYEVL